MTSTSKQPGGLLLGGIDGANPLAFLAALGTLRTLDVLWPEQRVRLSWRAGKGWTPAIHADGCPDEDTVADALMSYNESLKNGERSPDFAGFGDLIGVDKETFLSFVQAAMQQAQGTDPGSQRHEALDFAAAYGSDACLSEKGKIEPSLLSFANGQSGQYLLRSFRQIRDVLTADNLTEALFRPWSYGDERPTFRWDPDDCRPYAHRASDPGDSRNSPVRTMRGANYLAFLGLPVLPSFPGHDGLRTTGFARRRRQWIWTWPIWTPVLDLHCVRSVLALGPLQEEPIDRAGLARRGIAEVFRSRRFSYNKGLYFSPSTSA